MGSYEYFVLLIVVLMGMAVSDLTISLHKLLAAGPRVRWHWAAPAVALLSAVLVVGEFMSTWSSKNGTIQFLNALASLGLFVLLFLGAAAALPDEVPPEGLSLKTFYFGNRLHFWGLMTLFMLAQTLLVAANPVNRTSPGPFLFYVGQDLFVALVCASLIWIRQSWWHALCIVALLSVELLNWWNLKLG
jgi:hypothetical protein